MLNKIKEDSLVARKARDGLKAVLLTTLYSEAANVGKNNGNRQTTDAETVAVIKKFLKGIDETIKAMEDVSNDDGSADRYVNALKEQAILERYLPKQLTEAELVAIIAEIVPTLGEKSPKLMGKVLGTIKERYEGQYDGKLASTLVKAALA